MVGSTSAPSERALPRALEALLGLTPDGAIVVEASGEIRAANAAAREALGIEALAGESLAARSADPEGALAFVRLCARTTTPIPGSLVLRDPAGAPAHHAAAGMLIAPRSSEGPALLAIRFWPRDGASPFVLLSQKIAELHEEMRRRREAEDALRAREARLAEHARALEDAHRVKDQFLAAVSHELRTPLNAMLGWSVVLRSGSADPAAVERAAATIERNARAQAQLIDDLLDVSRIVTGQIRLDVRQIHPLRVVEAAIESLRPALDAKRIRLRAVLDPDAGPVMGDPARLQQVLWNLLSNAVKFSEKDGRIDVVLRKVDSSIEIEVTDSGIGIDPAFLPHVFELFRQADGSTTRRHGGLGLGLAISKTIVELHGGTIAAHSEGAGRGTRMSIRLPRAALRVTAALDPVEPIVALAAPLSCPKEIEGLRVVVVDDEPDSLALVCSLLERCGAEVARAASADEALALVIELRPDAVVSDIGMPEVDGYELVRRIRALGPEQPRRVPAVALTAYARAEDRTAAIEAGFDAHVAKPVEPRELLAVVARLAARHESGLR